MPHNAILGTQQFADVQVVDRTHPAIIRGKMFRQGAGELPRGKIVARDKNGQMAAYEPALAAAGTWGATTAHAVGDLILPATPNDHYYRCVTAGTTGAAEPAFPVVQGDTVLDGTVVWEDAGIIGVDDLVGGGVLTEVIDTVTEEVGAVLIHGSVVAANLDVAGAPAATADLEALDAIGVYPI